LRRRFPTGILSAFSLFLELIQSYEIHDDGKNIKSRGSIVEDGQIIDQPPQLGDEKDPFELGRILHIQEDRQKRRGSRRKPADESVIIDQQSQEALQCE